MDRSVRSKISNSGDAHDRISDLADHVLVQILVLLPLVEAVRTCVLSQRWRHVWTRLPRLEFNDDDDDSPVVSSFADLVAGVMLGYATDVHMPDVSISASCEYEFAEAAFRIAAAAFLAAGRAISKCDIFVSRDEEEDEEEIVQVPLQMPCFPWVQELSLAFIGMELRMPYAGTFNRLTKLHIMGVRFTDEGWALHNVVTWRCPCLKDLELHTIEGLKVLFLMSQSLLSLRLLNLMDLERLLVLGAQLRDMQVTESFVHAAERRHMLLQVPKLEQFHWEDRCPDVIYPWLLPSQLLRLTVVQLPLYYLTARDGGQFQYTRILQTFKSIKTLSLEFPITPESVEQNNLVENADISYFRELDLTVKKNEHTFGPTVLSLLNRNYWVKKFTLEIIDDRKDWNIKAPCASSCDCRKIKNRRNNKISVDYLNRVVMKNFSGTEDETYFLFSIVKNAKALYNVSIVSSMDVKTTEKFMQTLKKQSPSGCTIEFATI